METAGYDTEKCVFPIHMKYFEAVPLAHSSMLRPAVDWTGLVCCFVHRGWALVKGTLYNIYIYIYTYEDIFVCCCTYHIYTCNMDMYIYIYIILISYIYIYINRCILLYYLAIYLYYIFMVYKNCDEYTVSI